MFKPPHFLFMFLTLTTVILSCIAMKDKSKRKIEIFLKIAAVVIVFFDPLYWLWEHQTHGRFDFATTLPLYLCSLFWMLMPIAAFCKDGVLKRIAISNICTIGLLCGVFGIVFNVYLDRYSFFAFVPMRSLIYHVIMVVVPAILWTSGYFRPKRKDCLLGFIPVIVLLVPCLILNKLFGWDYCYTAGGIGTPLERISAHMPRPAFLIILFGSIFLMVLLMFYRQVIKDFIAYIRNKYLRHSVKL